jgi:hypothetical protein
VATASTPWEKSLQQALEGFCLNPKRATGFNDVWVDCKYKEAAVCGNSVVIMAFQLSLLVFCCCTWCIIVIGVGVDDVLIGVLVLVLVLVLVGFGFGDRGICISDIVVGGGGGGGGGGSGADVPDFDVALDAVVLRPTLCRPTHSG